MAANKLTGLDKRKLRRWLLVFFLAVAIPTALLIQQSYSQLKWEAFHQYQNRAEELAARIDNQLIALITAEEQRPFTDYSFLNVAGDPTANFIQRSPLSTFPVQSDIPGMIGYFQVDAAGNLMSPLLPNEVEQAGNYGISDSDLLARTEVFNRLQSVLADNQLVKQRPADRLRLAKDKRQDADESSFSFSSDVATVAPSYESPAEIIEETEAVAGQAAFDDLSNIEPRETKGISKYGRVEDLKLEQRYQQETAKQAQKKSKVILEKQAVKQARKEQSVLPEPVAEIAVGELDAEESVELTSPAIQPNVAPITIQTFDSEVEPFEFSLLDSGHFVLYRKVWRNEQRYIQGILIEQQVFLTDVINASFRETALAQMTNLLVAFQGNVLEAFSGQSTRAYLASRQDLTGELLYQTRLSAPLSEVQLLFSINHLPAGPGAVVINWLAFILVVVLSLGFYLMYRLGLGQINLANQQQDFVSSVSHELKTPLTSIRMYGEMLREGWASEEKKKSYYDFIYDESERLSRLINNVLLMAKLTRNSQHADLKQRSVSELMDEVKSKVSSQIERAGFELSVSCDEQAAKQMLLIDADWFNQIMINLVDNAIKFSAQAELKKVELACQTLSDGQIEFTVRDYGPGIEKQQLKKIFKLFYRSESELTRQTVGTGIGLALVHQMVTNMNGQIDVVNVEPGVEFKLRFLA